MNIACLIGVLCSVSESHPKAPCLRIVPSGLIQPGSVPGNIVQTIFVDSTREIASFEMVDEPFSFLQKTVKRIKNINFTLDPIIVCNQEHRFIVAEQMRKINIKPSSILLEPEGRNTAPAITSAALKASEKDNDPILLVLPSDHNIVDGINFEKVINSDKRYIFSVSGDPFDKTYQSRNINDFYISLLRLDQIAWAFAKQHRKLLVADSRTEIDWAIKQNRIPIWAPYGMYSKAIGLPKKYCYNPTLLTSWLANETQCKKIIELRRASTETLKSERFEIFDGSFMVMSYENFLSHGV